MRALMLGLTLVAAPAVAEEPRHVWTLSGAGGADLAANQLFGGAELAMHPNQDKGLAGQLLIQPTYSLSDNTLLTWVEAGGTVVLPYDEEPNTTFRLGVWVRAGVPVVRYPLPVRVGEPGSLGTGLIPSGGGLLELSWKARTLKKHIDRPRAERGWNPAAALGLRVGAGSEYLSCGFDEDVLPDCAAWDPGLAFTGYGRVDLRNKVHLEIRLGTTLSLSIGGILGSRPGGS